MSLESCVTPDHERARRLAAHKAQAHKRAAIAAAALATPNGQVLLEMLETEAGFRSTCYTRGDPHDTSYREGKRDMVVYIHELINRAKRDTPGDDSNG